MLDVLAAQLGVLVAVVVRLVGEAEAGLHEVDDVAAGVVAVVADVVLDEPGRAVALEPAHHGEQLVDVTDRVDLREVGGDRLGAERLDAIDVHERGVEVADLPLVGAGRGVRRGGLLEDGVHVLLRLVAQLVERAVGGPVRRDRGVGQPATVHVAEQVVLRADVAGQLVGVDP